MGPGQDPYGALRTQMNGPKWARAQGPNEWAQQGPNEWAQHGPNESLRILPEPLGIFTRHREFVYDYFLIDFGPEFVQNMSEIVLDMWKSSKNHFWTCPNNTVFSQKY